MMKHLIACALIALFATSAVAAEAPKTADAAKVADPKDAQIAQLTKEVGELHVQLSDAMTAVRVLRAQRDDALQAAQDAELKRWITASHAQAEVPTAPATSTPQTPPARRPLLHRGRPAPGTK